jgi:acylphosphatase
VATDVARLDALVRGRVQGVGFRYFVLREARRLDLDGWTSNEADGSVRVVVDWPPVASEGWFSGQGFSIRSGAHRGD